MYLFAVDGAPLLDRHAIANLGISSTGSNTP